MKNKCFAYLDQLNNNFAIFELVEYFEYKEDISATSYFLNQEVGYLDLHFPEDYEYLPIPNYYYQMQIYTNEPPTKSCIQITSSMITNFHSIFHDNEETTLWVSFEIDLDLSQKVRDENNESFEKIMKIESLHYKLRSISTLYDNDFKAWLGKQADLNVIITGFISSGESEAVRIILKLLNPYFRKANWDSRKDGVTDSLILQNSLINIQGIVESNLFEQNIEVLNDEIRTLLSLPGVGMTMFSKILHSLWPEKFSIYSQQFNNYISLLGYGTQENQIENEYIRYNKTITEIIKNVENGALTTNNSQAISFYISKKFNLIDCILN
jgi:hypothetical protein